LCSPPGLNISQLNPWPCTPQRYTVLHYISIPGVWSKKSPLLLLEVSNAKPSGSMFYTILHPQSPVVTARTARFNTQQFYVLPTECVYVFCVDLRTNSDYFPIQH
jgi:hypothetical protein